MLLNTTVKIITLTKKDYISLLRNSVLNKNPGMTFLEHDITKCVFPQKFVLIYDWKLLTCSITKIDEEYVV